MIDAQKLMQWRFQDVEQEYDEDFSILYALSIGIGGDPVDPRQLVYVNEVAATPLRAFPTMAVVLGFPGSWMANPETGIDFDRIVHGEEDIRIHRPLPVAATIVSRHRVVSVEDKGPGRGAIIVYDKEVFDAASKTLLATVRHTTFARGDGGFSRSPLLTAANRRLDAPPWVAEKRWEVTTLPQQALLYRLCADRNPLHSNPETARKAGFESPILHGLCTYGIAAHGLVAQWCDYDEGRLVSLRSRFVSPVTPGDRLAVRSTAQGSGVVFDVWNETQQKVVLSNGHAGIWR